MKKHCSPLLAATTAMLMAGALADSAFAQPSTAPHLTWHWHVHQPVYWNGQNRLGGVDRVEYAWESIQMKDGGSPHPTNDLRGIFGKEDRVAAYQWRMRDSLATFGQFNRSGVTVSYSGALMMNVRSLGQANQLGYSPGWKNALAEANSWTTTGGKRRLEFVNFSFHHGLVGLLPEETVYMSVRLHQELIRREFGEGAISRGFFPSEMTWSKRLIPVMKRLGVDWTIVSGEHIARACPDFPIQFGQGGIGCDPPNRADQINPNGERFLRTTIQRGVSPVNANPLSFQPAHQQWVNPETGEIQSIVVVPADQGWSWLEGYGRIDAQIIDDLKNRNDPAQPSLVLLAHDGDNDFAGGYTYYMENVAGLANDVAARGGVVTQISQYLQDFPPAPTRIVHVEDGGWVNADGDFGSPVYINWNYPLLNQSGQHDPANGWHEKVREMALFHEVQNRILTAEQLTPGYTRNFAKILEPDNNTHPIDRAWHYYLASFDSGNVYYGNVEDFSIKGTLGARKVDELIGGILASGAANDRTGPTVFVPQRHPYNPGSLNFGVAYASNQYQGRRYVNDGDFTIWTFVADVSQPARAVLKYRIDADGINPLNTTENETFAGGPGVGEWQEIEMVGREFPKGNVYNKPGVNYFLLGGGGDLLPNTMPMHFHAEVKGLRSTLIDYYVEATDARGNVTRSPIQHVYIGDGSGATGGVDSTVTVQPNPPVRGESVTVTYNSNGRNLAGAAQVYMHHGRNNYAGGAVSPDAVMTNAGGGLWTYTYTVPADALTLNMVFNNGSGTWDNNGGANWNFTTTGEPTPSPTPSNTPSPSPTLSPDQNPFIMDGQLDANVCAIGAGFHVAERNGWVYVATTALSGNDNFIYVSANPTPLVPANWAKAGQVGRYDFFLAGEASNDYSSWFDTTAAFADNSDFVSRRSGSLLEGAFRKSRIGSTAHVALGVFANADGGALVAQSPAGNGDGNLDTAEFLAVVTGVPICAEPTPSPSPTATPTPTASPSPSPSRTASPSPTQSASPTVSATPSATPSATASATPSPSATVSPTASAQPSASPSPSPSASPSPSPTASPSPAPVLIQLDRTTLGAFALPGQDATANTFTVRNGGGGTLNYTINWAFDNVTPPPSAVQIANHLRGAAPRSPSFDVNGDGFIDAADIVAAQRWVQPTGWMTVSPNTGSSTGEVDIINVTYDTDRLLPGTYTATISVSGNAGNSPQTIRVTLTISTTVPSPTPSLTPSPTATASPSPSATASPTATASASPTATASNSPTPSPSNTVTPTPSATPSPTPSATASATPTPTATPSASPTVSPTPSVSPTLGPAPFLTINPTAVSLTVTEGTNPANQTVTLGNGGSGTLNWTAAVAAAPPKNGAAVRGTRKTITVDGSNTGGEWTAAERIVTAPAFDNANVVGGNWSTHETQFDYTALYGAWDDEFLYVGIQISDVVDIEDGANAGSSQGTAPTQMNLPQFIAIDTRPGGYGAPTPLRDMWGKTHGFAGDDRPDYQVYFASNFWQGPFLCEYKDGWNPDRDAYGPPGQIYIDHPGLRGASSKADAGGPIVGTGGKDYRALGHNAAGRSSFFEVRIPLSLIGNPNLDTSSIGLFVGHGEGFSGVDTLPKDPAATNTPGVSQSNSPNEWEDSDVYTVPFARVGLGAASGGTFASVSPASGALGTGGTVPLILSFDTAGLPVGVHEAVLTVEGNATNSPLTVPITVTVQAPTAPLISVSATGLSTNAIVGANAANQTFTVRNSGAGTLDYTVSVVDTGSGTSWLQATPASGSSTGEADTITIIYNAASLAVGTYTARIDVAGNAANSPLSVNVRLNVLPAIPNTTTVVPNPPVAGAPARVWYLSTAGPIAGAAAYNLHWGINGGAAAGGSWQNVTTTAMTNAQQGGMWYADINIPIGATSLNFVFNDGNNNWDNNNRLDWNFLTAAPTTPVISVSQTTVSATAQPGTTPANSTFTVRNGGAGTLDYTLEKVDTGNGTAFFTVSPTSGSSTGEQDTITVGWNTAGLTPGTYLAGIQINGNADNAPVVVTASLTIGDPTPVVRPITIGRGPSLGTNTEGIEYFEEFQDWNADDLRGLDTNDAVALNDGYDMARDVVALYSRFENDNLFLRADLLELGILAEQGNVDVYVLIDCGPGGVTTLPNGLPGTTPAAWDIAVATYDAVNFAVIRSNGQQVANAHLGAYWRADLDSVEFGVRQSALRAAGWDGTSPVRLMAFTAKDLTTSVTDTLGFDGVVLSTTRPGRAKFATIAHGNQSLNRGDSMRDRIYISAARTGVGAPSGFRLTLDTHRLFQVPINIHMSGTLLTAINWIEDPNPIYDGRAFIDYVGSFVDANQAQNPGMKIGGVFSEHIMPFFVGEVNLNSIEHFDNLTRELWGIDGTDMKVMHIPERVVNSVAGSRDVWDDIVDSPYIATVIDEVAHIRNWLYPNDPWTGIGGQYGVPRQHKIHRVNGVYCFQINDNEDHYKFWPQDGGANMNWRLNLLWKALDTDQEQLTLIFDDWEALAGYSFGSGYNNNALQYNDVIRWVANKPWIEVVTLAEILDRATNPSNPRYSANWVIEQGDIGNKPFDTYDYLHHATEDSYENWYYGSALEESFRNAVPVISGVVGNGTPMPSGKIFGELGTPGTIIHDTWQAVRNAPNNRLRALAEKAYHSMIYETAWHDEDNTNYERTPESNYKQWRFPDTTYDRVSGWAFTLHNHLRGVTITTTAAQWVEAVKTGSRPAGVTVSAVDLDQDGQPEYVLANERLWLAFEARGGRCVQAYYYDASMQDAISFIGTSPMNNPSAQGEEEGTDTASRCSGFKDMNNGIYADAIYTVATGSNSLTFTSPNGQVVKTFTLTTGSNILTVTYNNTTGSDLFTRIGAAVNNIDLFYRGQNFTSTYTANTFTQTNNTRGRMTITGQGGVTINQLDAFTRFVIPLTEQMEVRLPVGTSTFTVSVVE